MLLVNLLFNREDFKKNSLDSISIIIAVILCVGISSVNNYQKERQYLALYNVSEESKYVRKKIHYHSFLFRTSAFFSLCISVILVLMQFVSLGACPKKRYVE